MSVLSVSVPPANVGILNISALKYGVQVSVIDITESEVFVDLDGEFDKSLRACLGARVTVLDSIQSIPGIKDGTGIPTPHVTEKYGTLMAMPR